jgi:hypothetical protein
MPGNMETPNKLFSMNVTGLRYLVAATALTLMTLPLRANVLLPGGSVTPDVFSNPGSSPPPALDDISGTFSFGSGAGLLTGSWEEVVLVDPLGITCVGCLDFAFQLTEDPLLSTGIFNASLSSFFGYTTDVGYVNGTGRMGGSGGAGTPILVNRITSGAGVDFVFVNPTSGAAIGPGGQSAVLVVATNATSFDSLGTLGIAGSPGINPITGLFEPSRVPEPSTALLLSLGLAGIAALRKRTR